MALTQSQKSLIQKTRSVGAAREAESLSDADCQFLVAVIARDLGLLSRFPEFQDDFPEFFQAGLSDRPSIGKQNFDALLERLIKLDPNADSFFNCLGTLYKARIKYANILKLQPIPTMDQVGPRGLLQYGSFSATGLTGFLLWRKWLFDIDNRAGQETGYLFEPIIAAAIGGVPISAKKSPVRRSKDSNKGRQVDALKGNHAYEIKVRVTIAASGQGRWGEELDFPVDCANSGFSPILVVLDPTANPKLETLTNVFRENGGHVYVGDAAWEHLDAEAGPTMAKFLEAYVRHPISELLKTSPDILPDMTLSMRDSSFSVQLDSERFSVERLTIASDECPQVLPNDVDDMMPGI